MSVFNYAFKNNFAFSSAEKPTDRNIITPGGFSSPVSEYEITPGNIHVEIVALNTVSLFSPEEVDLSANGLLCCFNLIYSGDASFKMISMNAELTHFDFTRSYTLDIPLNVSQQAIVSIYHNSIVASKTASDNIVQYSATYADSK